MAEYIEREAAKRKFFNGPEFVYLGPDVYDRLDEVPAADVAPVKHGRWEKSYADHEAFGVRPFFRYCSLCNEATVYPYRFCPNCGARMDAGGADADTTEERA